MVLDRRFPPVRPTADTSPPKTPGQGPAGTAAPLAAAVKSEALFDGASEVLIHHRGVVYRLRQTSLGKLILTK
jgi:hemin uptake protein HemP